ncbi:hypothetical protein LIER_02974 [Lithospermum erythrorhizon]|uniref:Conserved oligomeric Golgi complex subunit 2 n=1 Tax=Lithospermum erythrorhizon TaxID=34254 RepID=A0AAV3NRI2_LITER
MAMDLFGEAIDAHPPWLNPPTFLSNSFDPQHYISDLRSFVPLESLRWELKSHLSSLKVELIDLINRDYSDFVSLSTKLVDVEGSVVRMRAPLLEIKEMILGFREALQDSLLSLENRLDQRTQANRAREVLEILLDTFHVVSKVEKLIKELPSVPVDWSNGHMSIKKDSQLSNGINFQHGENGTNLRETQSMLLERIASEMNRLKFYITLAKDMPFIENMERRIQSASLLLDTSLGHCLGDALDHRDESAIYNCLRAYAAIDNTKSAEEIFRSTVVRPLIQKVIPSSSSGGMNEASEDELELDYKVIKRYIEDDCKFLLEISSKENSGLHVFSFLANSILKEVLFAIQKRKPGAFSSGRPTKFLKNYKSSLEFLTHLEGYCTSRSAVARFRAEDVYIEFMRQWNVGVYFKLRFQEIAGALDSALVVATLEPILNTPSDNTQGLILQQSLSLMQCLRSCWKDDILVVSCSDKFLRLTLQLLARYSNWLSTGLAARKTGDSGVSQGCEWAISASPDDLIYIVHDLNSLVIEVTGTYLGDVIELLKSCPKEVIDLVKASILEGGNSLKDALPPVINSIVDTLVVKSVEDLKHMKGITATYRMTNKPLPVRHSPYVTGVLRPLKVFVEGDRATNYLPSDTRDQLVHRAATEITDRYHELAADLVSVARRTESSLLKIRKGAQRRTGTSTDVSDNNVSDTDKICMQLFLDIQEYARNLSLLGVEAADIPAYRSLWQCVAPPDRQSKISY